MIIDSLKCIKLNRRYRSLDNVGGYLKTPKMKEQRLTTAIAYICEPHKNSLPYGFFDDLQRKQKDVILTMLSRYGEICYRRGVQQALYYRDHDIDIDAVRLRFHIDNDLAPCLDNMAVCTTSYYRLLVEQNSILMKLGLL